jgi:hypothetical protein
MGGNFRDVLGLWKVVIIVTRVPDVGSFSFLYAFGFKNVSDKRERSVYASKLSHCKVADSPPVFSSNLFISIVSDRIGAHKCNTVKQGSMNSRKK